MLNAQFEGKNSNLDTFNITIADDYYIVYDDDIEKVKNMLPVNEIVKIKNRKEIRLSIEAGEKIIKDALVDLHMSVNEFTYGNPPTLNRTGRPGNWNDFEYLCLDERSVPSTAAVRLKNSEIEISFFKAGLIMISRFTDDDIFSKLYSTISLNNIVDVVFNDPKMERILNSFGVDNHRYRGREDHVVDMLKDYLNLENVKVQEYIRTDCMNINNDVFESLNMEGVIKLYNLRTVQGVRLIRDMFKAPLRSIGEILARHDLIRRLQFAQISSLKGISDLSKFSRMIERGNINLSNLLKLSTSIHEIGNLIVELGKDDLECEIIVILNRIYNELHPLEDEIRKRITDDAHINPQICPALFDISNEKKKVEVEIKKEHSKVLKINPKIRIEKGGTFRIPRGELKAVSNEFNTGKFFEIGVFKNGISFTTAGLSNLNAQINDINRRISESESEEREKLVSFSKRFVGSIDGANHIIAYIDVLKVMSEKIVEGWEFPTFTSTPTFVLKDAFHPLIMINPIKNDLFMTDKRFVVVTGPNMGGKSTFLRMCGILTILAQGGSPVPASSFTLSIFDGIYVRVGANDSPSTNTSTFMNEMVDAARISQNATDKSLVLIDELGRGTSVIDGLSISLSFKEFLLKKKCFSILTTHFPEMCSEDTLNKRVTVLPGNKLSFKIEDGVCNSSYGIEVAKAVGFPSEVIHLMEKYIDEGV